MEKILNYNELIDDLLEIDHNFILIKGNSDVKKVKESFQFKEIKRDDFYIIIGGGNEDYIIESLKEERFSVDREGDYEFIFLLKYIEPEFDSGHMIMRGYYEILESRLQFIQTFEQREREEKLNDILTDEFYLKMKEIISF